MKIIIKNIILFAVGYCAYIAIEVTYRGFSHPFMGLCGGLALMIMDKINDYIFWTLNNINAIMLGSSEINTIYLGTNIVWTKKNSN